MTILINELLSDAKRIKVKPSNNKPDKITFVMNEGKNVIINQNISEFSQEIQKKIFDRMIDG